VPVCTTVVWPPVAFDAAPNAAPAAAPLAIGWLLCGSSAGGGACAGGGVCAGGGCASCAAGGVCDDASGVIATMMNTVITTRIGILRRLIRPPSRSSDPDAFSYSGIKRVPQGQPSHVIIDASCCHEMHRLGYRERNRRSRLIAQPPRTPPDTACQTLSASYLSVG